MTLNEITYNLLNIVRGGRIADDEQISQRQIGFMVSYYRALLIRRNYERKKEINPQLIQDLGCVELELADRSECCDVDLATGCYVLRTVEEIPKLIEFSDRIALEFVGSIDKVKSFQQISAFQQQFYTYSKYTGKKEAFYYQNNRVYVINNTVLERINIRGIFEDPTEASRFHHCSGEPCYSMDSTYPIAAHMLAEVNSLILSKEFQVEIQAPTDDENDAQHNPK